MRYKWIDLKIFRNDCSLKAIFHKNESWRETKVESIGILETVYELKTIYL